MSENLTLQAIYVKAVEFARNNQQTVGQKNDYYITIEQLDALLQSFESSSH